MFIRTKRKLKFIHINCHSLNKKRDTLKERMVDLGENTKYGITETWFAEHDEKRKYMKTSIFSI